MPSFSAALARLPRGAQRSGNVVAFNLRERANVVGRLYGRRWRTPYYPKIRSSRDSVIVAKEPAQTRAAPDWPVCRRWSETFRGNEPIVNTLVIPFPMVVGYERCERSAQVGFPKDDDPIQAFLLDRPDKSLRVRIAVGCLKRRLHDPDADIGQGLAERRAPFGISIADQDSVALRTPSSALVSTRATWSTKASSGCAVDPTRCTRRDSSSMTKSV